MIDMFGKGPSWKIWLLFMLIGGLLGGAVSLAIPARYRARATVTVDFNIEKTWQGNPDNEIFYFLDREARKLEELAWDDATLDTVSQETGVDISTLRNGTLELSQPKDGGWHFYAYSSDPQQAIALASSWAKSFTEQTQSAIMDSINLDAARAGLAQNPTDATLTAKIAGLEKRMKGIQPGIEISTSQVNGLNAEKIGNPAWYMLSGAVLGLLVAFFLQFSSKPE